MAKPHDRTCPHKGSPRFERLPVISSHYRNRIGRQTPEYEPPPVPPDYQVAGPLVPQANGAYYETGTYNGKPYYTRLTGQAWIIWYKYGNGEWNRWYITPTLGDLSTFRWHRRSADYTPPPGSFDPGGGATGTAIITAI